MITLNGTTGITTPDVITDDLTVDTNTLYVDATNNRVGIGTSSPATNLDISGTGQKEIRLTSNTSGNARLGFNVAGSVYAYWEADRASGAMIYSNGTERMRIDSIGDLLVGASSKHASAGGAKVYSSDKIAALSGYLCKAGQAATTFGNIFNINWTGTPQLWIDTTNVGTIALTSDYRIKKNVETQTSSAIERMMQLRPVTYTYTDYGTLFKADGVTREGFIAHELAEVIPSAVEGEKDAEDQIQSLKLDALCSVMVKAIQEQQETIKALEARVATLEGN